MVLYDDVPHKARIGLVIHEFMHIRDYQKRHFLGLLKRGWQYLSRRGKHRFEHEIDQMAIDAGYGRYLFSWSSYVLEKSDVDEKYLEFKKDVYMNPEDILSEMEQKRAAGLLKL